LQIVRPLIIRETIAIEVTYRYADWGAVVMIKGEEEPGAAQGILYPAINLILGLNRRGSFGGLYR